MTFRVELTEAAAAQVEAAIAWWRDNRPRAVALLETELEYTFELLEKLPPSTQVWDEIEGKPVRKARLPRTRYALYFTVVGDLVTMIERRRSAVVAMTERWEENGEAIL